MSVKALKQQLAAAIAMMIVAALALSSSTYAWFAANTQVTAKTVTVAAETVSGIIIEDATTKLPTSTQTTLTFDNTDDADKLIPTEYNSGSGAGNLRYVNNPGDVDKSTGLAKTGKTLTYTDAANGTPTGKNYYIDKDIYIAADSADMVSQDLTVTLSGSSSNNVQKAISVDFYVATGAATPAYVDTLNMAGLSRSTNNGSAAKTSVTLLNKGTIGVKTGTSYIHIIARFYVDGGLKSEAAETFINNEDAISNGTALSGAAVSLTFDTTENLTT